MTPTWLLAATAFLALTAGLPGYEREAYNGQPLHRPPEVWFSVDPSAVPGLKNADGGTVLTAESDPVAALRAAMEAWNTARGAAVSLNLKVSAARAPAFDFVNSISFDDTPAARSVVGSAIAVTMTTYTTGGVIVDSDIIFNPALTFATEPTPGAFDLQAIATHELGHCLGADHSLLRSATMFEGAMPEETSPRYLSSDDTAFAADAYPAGTPPGRVAGSVTFTSSTPVPEALMLAINPETGFVVATNSVSGFYAVSGLPPGNYLVAAIPPYSANWQTSFYGGAPPQTVSVTANQTTHADLTVPDGPASMRIDWADFGAAGLSFFCLVPSGGALNAAFSGSGFPDTILPEDIFIYGGGISVREEQVESWPGGLSFRADAAARNDWGDAVIAVRRAVIGHAGQLGKTCILAGRYGGRFRWYPGAPVLCVRRADQRAGAVRDRLAHVDPPARPLRRGPCHNGDPAGGPNQPRHFHHRECGRLSERSIKSRSAGKRNHCVWHGTRRGRSSSGDR